MHIVWKNVLIRKVDKPEDRGDGVRVFVDLLNRRA